MGELPPAGAAALEGVGYGEVVGGTVGRGAPSG